MEIRSITLRDLTRGFRQTLDSLRPVGNLSDQQMQEVLLTIAKNHLHGVFVAVENDEVVGTITLFIEQKFIREGGKVGHIEDVAVRDGWQRRGIGKQLVEYAVSQARKFGCYKVILDCDSNHVGFYESLGFRKHEIEMRLDL